MNGMDTNHKKWLSRLLQRSSNDGKGFPQMHIHIMNIKGWLCEIHHHCSKKRLQGYLDENFRFNRRSQMGTIFDVLLRRMVNNSRNALNREFCKCALNTYTDFIISFCTHTIGNKIPKYISWIDTYTETRDKH